MKKSFITIILAISLFVSANVSFAQNQQETLPSAGLTPENPFYFLDKFGETLREFFTFNPEGKARLQITFAAERIAEINVILKTKDVEAKGLKVAQSRLKAHLANVATIINKQKTEGKNVSELAKELDDKFENPKTALEETFKSEKRDLQVQEKELKNKIFEARRTGDTTQVESLTQQLSQIKAQKELLEVKEKDIDDELEIEEEKLEEEMEIKEKAEKAIREAEEEKQEVLDEAAEEDVKLPANAFTEFESLLAQAKNALQTGNFVEAKNLAKRAEKSLDQIEKTIKELEKKQEKKIEAEEAIKEAEEEKQEVLDEIKEKGIELPVVAFAKFDRLLSQAKELFAKENYQGAKQLAKQAEDALEDADKEMEKLNNEKEQEEEQTKDDEEKMLKDSEKERD